MVEASETIAIPTPARRHHRHVRHGAFHRGNLGLSALAIVPALVGMWLGTIIRGKISAKPFRISFLCCLGVLGVELAGRALLSP